jgi:hypothetical protein
MTQQGQQSNEQQFTQDDIENFDFLCGIYPTGRKLSSIYKDTMMSHNCPIDDATNLANGQLSSLIESGLVVQSSVGESSGIILTDSGVSKIWKYMDEKLWNVNRIKYFAFLREWVLSKDHASIIRYKRRVVEVFLMHPEIVSMLVIPHYEHTIFKHYARIRKKEVSADLVADVMEYLGDLSGIKLIEIREEDTRDGPVNAYFLTRDGIAALRLMHNFSKEVMENPERAKVNNIPTVKGKKKVYQRPTFALIVSIVLSLMFVSSMWSAVSSDQMLLGLLSMATIFPVIATLLVRVFFIFIRKIAGK